ncbi:MAG: asparaginase [Actinobacteria bacterium]|nr:asparaginase [Actinomycetota bacterium]
MRVVRDGAIDALHSGHVVVVGGDGDIVAAHGDPTVVTYPRSALKPFQAAAVLEMAGARPPTDELAIMAASHVGTHAHQVAVVGLLDRAGLTAGALRCPPALPTDAAALRQRPAATRLAHNCSGKHAGFLLAAVGVGAPLDDYLHPEHPVQQAVLARLRAASEVHPQGPGVDGCGAPAWRLPLHALARAFVALADADAEASAVATAMRTHPALVGGHQIVDTELMQAEPTIVAKRGAEGTLACVVLPPVGPLGIAIKVSDGAARAVGPVAVAIIERFGLRGAHGLRCPEVLGGGVRHGAVEVTDELERALAGLT